MKKILHVLKSTKYSGAENVVCQIINMFKEDENYEMVYVSPEGPIKETLKEKNIEYLPIKNLTFLELRKIIKKYKPDIIHAHDMTATVICSLFASKRIKVISHIHGTFKTLAKKNLKSLIFYLAVKKCKKIIFVSTETYKSFIYRDKIKNKCVSLRNIINPIEIDKKIKEDKLDYNNDIIFLGRLVDVKNPERFIKVVEQVKNKIPEIQVAIVGDGELKRIIEDLIREKKLSKNVKLYGFMNNPYKILSQSKVLVMTSKSEGTPMVSLEAMALGIPIVSTPVDGLKEVVINNKNGFLSDSNLELSNFIINLIKNKNDREKISINAKKIFNEINDTPKYKKNLLSIYEENN